MSENQPPAPPPPPGAGGSVPPPPPGGVPLGKPSGDGPPPPPPPGTSPGPGAPAYGVPGAPGGPGVPGGYGAPGAYAAPGGAGAYGAYGGPGAYGAPGGSSGYDVGKAFSYGFDKLKSNPGPLVALAVAAFLVPGIIYGIGFLVSMPLLSSETTFNESTGELQTDDGSFLLWALVFMLFVALALMAMLVLQVALMRAALKLTRGEPLDVGGAFSGVNWGQVVVAALLVAVGTFVGYLLCVVPGLIFAFLASYTMFFVVDQGRSPVDAVKASIDFTRQHLGPTLLFYLASLVAYLVGGALCGVGLLVAVPVVIVGQAYTYRTLRGEPVAP